MTLAIQWDLMTKDANYFIGLHQSTNAIAAEPSKVRKKDIEHATELIISILEDSCLSRSELILAAAHGFTGNRRTLDEP